jgi:hypothetical protein
MKKSILSFLLLVAMSATGQNFPTDSALWKEWYYDIECLNLPFCYERQYLLAGDTIIGNKTYNKIFLSIQYFNNPYYDVGYQGAVYYDNAADKVYWRPANTSQDTLLYDFNLSVGDTLPETYIYQIGWGNIIRIDSIDTVMTSGHTITRYHMDNAGWGSEYILHGIGSTIGFLETIYPFFESENHLGCFRNYIDSIYYPDSSLTCDVFTDIHESFATNCSIGIYPNPVKDILNIDNASGFHAQLFSITGLLISETEIKNEHFELKLKDVPEGMYFLRFEKDLEIKAKKIIVQH